VKWQGHDAVKLTGVWNPDSVKQIVPPGQTGWPALMRGGRAAYFDPKTRWPYRIEWWGPSPTQAADALLLQMEFRNPKLNVPMSPEQHRPRVPLQSRHRQVTDRTDEQVQNLNEIARQIKARKKDGGSNSD